MPPSILKPSSVDVAAPAPVKLVPIYIDLATDKPPDNTTGAVPRADASVVEVNVTLPEYILGKKLQIKYLDGNYITVNMLPFSDLSKALCISNKGLRKNKGDLYISVNITLPDKEEWNSQTIDFKEKLLNSLNNKWMLLIL